MKDQLWKMRATREDKKIIYRAAKRLRLTQSDLVRILVRIADELTQKEPNKEQPTAP